MMRAMKMGRGLIGREVLGVWAVSKVFLKAFRVRRREKAGRKRQCARIAMEAMRSVKRARLIGRR